MIIDEYLGNILFVGIIKMQKLEAELANKEALIQQQTQNITNLKKEIEDLKKSVKND